MKKIIYSIITLCLFFSSLYTTFANESYMERLLDINYGVEEKKLDLSEIKYVNFYSLEYQRMYQEFKTADSILRNGIIKNYRSGKYTYYQTNGIIKNYNNFIYYSNRYFYHLSLKERGYKYTELDTAIIKNYTNMRRSFRYVKKLARIK